MIWRSQHGWDMNGQDGIPSPKVKGKDSVIEDTTDSRENETEKRESLELPLEVHI